MYERKMFIPRLDRVGQVAHMMFIPPSTMRHWLNKASRILSASALATVLWLAVWFEATKDALAVALILLIVIVAALLGGTCDVLCEVLEYEEDSDDETG
jgi:heme A synthase